MINDFCIHFFDNLSISMLAIPCVILMLYLYVSSAYTGVYTYGLVIH